MGNSYSRCVWEEKWMRRGAGRDRDDASTRRGVWKTKKHMNYLYMRTNTSEQPRSFSHWSVYQYAHPSTHSVNTPSLMIIWENRFILNLFHHVPCFPEGHAQRRRGKCVSTKKMAHGRRVHWAGQRETGELSSFNGSFSSHSWIYRRFAGLMALRVQLWQTQTARKDLL